MFYAARVKNDLIIKIDYRYFLGGVGCLLFGLLISIWVFWFVALKNELRFVKQDVYTGVSKSTGKILSDSFATNYISLLQYENCQAKLKQCQAINTDLGKMVSIHEAKKDYLEEKKEKK